MQEKNMLGFEGVVEEKDQVMNNILDNAEMITSEHFYEESVKVQRRNVIKCIMEAMETGDPLILLPFDTYPVIEDELEQNGWVYEQYHNDGKPCAMFYPKQYDYDCCDDEETCENNEEGHDYLEDYFHEDDEKYE